MIWLRFLISAAVIVWAGIHLTRHVDRLSDYLGWGKVWIGAILLGFVTSLPEVVSSLTAVLFLKADNLALGNLLGSNNFNPMLLVVMDVAYRQGSITNAIVPHRAHKIAAGLAVGLTLVVIIGIFFPWGRLSSFVVAAGYWGGMRYLSGLEKNSSIKDYSSVSRRVAGLIIARIVWNAVLVIGAAVWLAELADQLAIQTGLGRTFFGSIFLAFVTSLPEMVVSLSALRLGSFDLAVGNIFGSNMMNLFIVVLCDLVHRPGAFLDAVRPEHILTAFLSIILTGVMVGGIGIKNKKSLLGLGWDSFIMIILFFLGTGVLYQQR